MKEVRELHPIEQAEIAKEGAEAIISVAPQYEPKLTHKSTKRSKLDIEDDTFGGKSFDRSSIDKRATLVGIRASEIMSEHSARSKHSHKHKSNSSMSSQSHLIDEEASQNEGLNMRHSNASLLGVELGANDSTTKFSITKMNTTMEKTFSAPPKANYLSMQTVTEKKSDRKM